MTDITLEILSICRQLAGAGGAIAAIDGRCAAGKTTLAQRLHKELDCNIIHMDDFFLREEQRSASRLEAAGGNVDRERFLSEVLLPLKRGEAFSYRPYDCKARGFKDPVEINPRPLAIVEGSYSCHPSLWDFYDYHIFLTVSSEEQLKRLNLREGREACKIFIERWIPLEERYFKAFSVRERCELCADTETGDIVRLDK